MKHRLSAVERHLRRLLALVGLAAAGTLLSPAFGQITDPASCGPVKLGFGPFDYRPDKHKPVGGIETRDGNEHKAILLLVEGAHFTPEVEQAIRGHRGYLGGDIGYTLGALPNHHRALITVMRYGEKMKSQQPKDLPFSVECYFYRAIRFAPDDPIVRMLYATYLNKNNRQPAAIQQLEQATVLAGDNGFTNYNVGMVYLEIGLPERALKQAHRAMALDFGRQELRQKLQALNKWEDPPAAAASGEAAASAPAGDAAPAPAHASAAASR